ncbi:MAG TPA: RDD family protein, partial [Candidatus Bathyarchaeia archaeon]|nr:RDD family protein [Candidatus Bathyarchaeia archaeon]
DEDIVSRVLSVLSHPLRRKIILYLDEKKECSFTELAKTFGVGTGKLSFHLRTQEEFLEQTPEGRYRLSIAGQNAINVIKYIQEWRLDVKSVGRKLIYSVSNVKKRVFAFLIDFGLSLVVAAALPSIPFLLFPVTLGMLNISIMFFLAFFFLYSTLLEGFSGQTLGKFLIGIKAIHVEGKKLSYDQAAVRNLGKVFLLPVDLWAGRRLKDERYLRFFDKYSGTTVTDVQPKLRVPRSARALVPHLPHRIKKPEESQIEAPPAPETKSSS